jgi:hypothetical protein
MRKIAFLVGNDTFPEDPKNIPPLRFPQNDATGLAEILGDKETCGFETKLYLNGKRHDPLLLLGPWHTAGQSIVPCFERNEEGEPWRHLDPS